MNSKLRKGITLAVIAASITTMSACTVQNQKDPVSLNLDNSGNVETTSSTEVNGNATVTPEKTENKTATQKKFTNSDYEEFALKMLNGPYLSENDVNEESSFSNHLIFLNGN